MREYSWSSSVKKYLENIDKEEIIIIGNDSFTVEIYETILALKKYKIPYVVTDNEKIFKEKNVDIKGEEDFHNIPIDKKQFFFVARLSSHKESYEMLTKKGLTINKDFVIMGIGGYTKPIDAIDPLLGFSRLENDIPGFSILGNPHKSEYIIVILGNSTSDPSTGMIKSWPDMLYEKIKKNCANVVLYNGATTGYCSTQEFLKLNRDVIELTPDLVISFSGYNDIEGTSSVEGYPFLHKYSNKFYSFLLNNPRLAPDSMYIRNVNKVSYGNCTKKRDFDIWVSNMKKMKAICDVNNICFLSFFQPMLEMENVEINSVNYQIIQDFYAINGVSKQEIKDKVIEYNKNVKKLINGLDYIIDCTHLFNGTNNMFYDTCHYTEKGNEVISEKVLEEILFVLNRRGETR